MTADHHEEQNRPDVAQGQAAEGNTLEEGDLVQNQFTFHLPNVSGNVSQLLKPAGNEPQPGLPQVPTDKIVFKGLRSFEKQDAKFFLSLLPGPFDANGLPESIRFWKVRIEETDPNKAFRVGLLYGPSGCGKSSLMDAGIIPKLAASVISVHIEATGQETETRLLNALRRCCPDLPPKSNLLSTLQKKDRLPKGKKLLIVIDQFEQWLHSKSDADNSELLQALIECDGERVQCILMVRDDFWTPVSRFLRQLKIQQQEGKNMQMVDLFDQPHAKKVLTAFGRAFEALDNDLSSQQVEFLNQAVAGLAHEGRVISVRLALFVEMMKGKAWTPLTLKDVGGTEGVGVRFLEATFSAATAPPQHRQHQKAAQAVLKALLPETGTDIKSYMRSKQELLEASGYGFRPKDFDELLSILDSEIRLITPTDPEGYWADSSTQFQPWAKYYQLTHDYLVPSLRVWLTRKQAETRRGRAELLVEDRAVRFAACPENRQLPSFVQWLSIRWLTAKKNWTPPQRRMMQKANIYHSVRVMTFGLLTVTGLAVGEQFIDQRKAIQSAVLVRSLLNEETDKVPGVVAKIFEYRKWTTPLLREEFVKAEKNSSRRLHTSLALLPVDAEQVDYLFGRLLDAAPQEVPVIRDALAPHKYELLAKLWTVAETPDTGKESQRLRAASALATYDPENQRWATVQEAVANDLVKVPADTLAAWMNSLRPVRMKLIAPLSDVYRNANSRAVERSMATDILANYAADQPQVLADLVMDADEKQFAAIYPKFKEQGEHGLPILIGVIDRKLPPDATDEAKEKLAKRQANAAVALLRMNQGEQVWPLLKHSPDPRVRSYLIHRLSHLGADAEAIIKRLDEEPDSTIRRALILSIGEYGEKEFPFEAQNALLPKLQAIYRTAPDPGLHAATEWLLRTWKQEVWLKQVNEEWVKDKELRARAIRAALAPEAKPQWYINGQGQVMVVIPGPVEFMMGSPPAEAGRDLNETQHKKRIGRTFAIAAKAVTLAEYQRFNPDYGKDIKQWARTPDSPVVATSWFQAAEYCNWLSKQEGIPESEWCYEPLIDSKEMPMLAASTVGLLGSPFGYGALSATCGIYPGRTDPDYTRWMKLAANYLKRSGYRLPTEAEMEYATRAGALTSRYYGETEDLLPKYGWYVKNGMMRSWPVGSLKPNDLGLFDMHGNVWCWCGESFESDGPRNDDETVEDNEGKLVVYSTDSRVLRGGSFSIQASEVCSACRLDNVPTLRLINSGFRPTRTITP